jgi:hypothetical protein
MLHWSVTDEPVAEELAPAAAPPLLAPIERVAEILEQLFLKESELVTALPAEPGRCDTSGLAKLFAPPPPPADTSVAYGSAGAS